MKINKMLIDKELAYVYEHCLKHMSVSFALHYR